MLKPVLQAVLLLYMMLARLPVPALVLLQLPPAIPTMAVVSLAAWWHHARLIYDWHNFAYTLMALNLGRHHWLVRAVPPEVAASLACQTNLSLHTCAPAQGAMGQGHKSTLMSHSGERTNTIPQIDFRQDYGNSV